MSTWRDLLLAMPLLFLAGQGAAFAAASAPTAPAAAEDRRPREVGVPLLRNFSPVEYGAGPQNWAVVQDRRGVIYVGNTDGGVLEYDGSHWRSIAIPNKGVVRSLAVGTDGRVYVGSVGDFGYLDPDTHGSLRFVSLLDKLKPQYRHFADVWRIAVTGDGIYFFTAKGLFRVDGAQVDIWQPQTSFHLMFQVGEDIYVREVGRGLLKLSAGRLQLVAGGERFADERIYAMLPWPADADDATGDAAVSDGANVLIGTRTEGWFIYDGDRFRPWLTEADAALKRDQIYGARWLSNGKLAVATLQGGVTLLDRHGHALGRLGRAEGLINDIVYAMYEDRQHGLWLALDNGLARLDAGSPLSYFADGSGLDGTVLALHRHHGTLYAGTTKGVFRLRTGDDGNARFVQVPGIAAQVWAFADVDQSLLVATVQGVVEIRAGVVERGAIPPCASDSCVGEQAALSLLRSPRDPSRVFVGQFDGLVSMRREHGRWIDEGKVAGTSGEIRALAVDSGGHVWLGSLNDGAMRLTLPDSGLGSDRPTPQVQHFKLPKPSAGGSNLADVKVLAGVLRVITDHGIYRFDDSRQQLVADRSFAHLFAGQAQQPSQLSEGAHGRIWTYSTDNGGALREIRIAIPDEHGGYRWQSRPLQALSNAYVSAIYNEADGITWLSTSDGVYRYDSHIEVRQATPLTTLLRKVSEDDGRVLWGGAGAAASPTLNWAHNSLRFDYAAPLVATAASRFQVMLEGVDRQWSTWSGETWRNYTNIPEGSHRFRVRARDASGDLGPEAVYDFSVLPPWYRTWWAYLIYLSLGLLLTALGVQLRSAVLQRRNRELRRLVEQRTGELSASHAALQEANAALHAQSITDPLTGLKNRRYVFDHIEQDVAAVRRHYLQYGADVADHHGDLLFLIVDVDHFKQVNDRHGHDAGDRVLKQLSEILRLATREADTVVRWGGEEFLIIARATGHGFGAAIAERIRHSMAAYEFDLGSGTTGRYTCSIGFASYPVLPTYPARFGWEEVIGLADQCLYAAKDNGRNAWAGVQSTHEAAVENPEAPLSADIGRLVGERHLKLLLSPACCSTITA